MKKFIKSIKKGMVVSFYRKSLALHLLNLLFIFLFIGFALCCKVDSCYEPAFDNFDLVVPEIADYFIMFLVYDLCGWLLVNCGKQKLFKNEILWYLDRNLENCRLDKREYLSLLKSLERTDNDELL